MALVNEQAVANTGGPVGFLNPAIYAIGRGGNYVSDFHDTTVGNNFRPGSPAAFPAATGYDLCTGWGTPFGASLINALAGASVPFLTSASLLPSGLESSAYYQALTVAGGVPAYTFSVLSGELPSNVNLGGNGVLSGVPASSGVFNFTVKVADSRGASSTKQFSLMIYPASAPVIGTTGPLAKGNLGLSYTQTLSATGGSMPYTWSLASGSLPGLTISIITGPRAWAEPEEAGARFSR